MNPKVFKIMKSHLDRVKNVHVKEKDSMDNLNNIHTFFDSITVKDVKDYHFEIVNGAIRQFKEPSRNDPYSFNFELRMGHPTKGGNSWPLRNLGRGNLPRSLNEKASELILKDKYSTLFWECARDYMDRNAHAFGLNPERRRDEYLYFANAPTVEFIEPEKKFDFNIDKVVSKLEKISDKFISSDYPWVDDVSIIFSARKIGTYYMNSEGSKLFQNHVLYKTYFTPKSIIKKENLRIPHLWKSRNITLPDFDSYEKEFKKNVLELRDIQNAPQQRNYSCPVIMCGDNSGVIFHEAIGHGIEGHRLQKDGYGETNLFKERLGEKITSNFVNVYDDPTIKKFNGIFLDGSFEYDEEGVKSQRVDLIRKGVLKNYLHSRESAGYLGVESNGHSRGDEKGRPHPRMGNLFVESSKPLDYKELEKMLIQECKKQGKTYGLLLVGANSGWVQPHSGDEFEAGTTYSSFPSNVFRLHISGKKQRVRGIHVTGDPDGALANVKAMSNRIDVRNGECGAESGFIPHAIAAPDTLFEKMTVDKIPDSSFENYENGIFLE